ncbi:MAG: hypothetical protein H0W44_00475 [Gammaproteobacteria bacterium]|nr:hypothetical protein [Gammaproteobacteria bacterium]
MNITPIIEVLDTTPALWPLARTAAPVSLSVSLASSLLSQDQHVVPLRRLLDVIMSIAPDSRPLVVVRDTWLDHARGALQGVPVRWIAVPEATDALAAKASAALEAAVYDTDSVLWFVPGDLQIQNPADFEMIISEALLPARDGYVGAFGECPVLPVSGKTTWWLDTQGILRARAGRGNAEAITAHAIDMCMLNSKTCLQRFNTHAAWFDACKQVYAQAKRKDNILRLTKLPELPEKNLSLLDLLLDTEGHTWWLALNHSAVRCQNWQDVIDTRVPDKHNNLVLGDVVTQDCQNLVALSANRKLALLGVRNHIVVETADSVLIADRSRIKDISELVARMQRAQGSETQRAIHEFHAWGDTAVLARDANLIVQRHRLAPGQTWEARWHHHRYVSWLILHGTARIQLAEGSQLLTEHQSLQIPMGKEYRLHNPGAITLEILEIQTGPYLGEDDILTDSPPAEF